MKPLRIQMQAFGPFAQSAQVDFRVLTKGGLFLIHGPTGAGKTSLLDGLCFALFGKASGSERLADGLRSDLAPPDRPTEVSLEFALGQDIYRITRRPRQTIRKLRGEGVTNARPEGNLWQLSRDVIDQGTDWDAEGAWNLIASGDKKTDERISELLGMTEEQFRQVVVLPQGQFRKFLSANSDQRESLLETLFRSVRYRNICESLDAKAKDLASQITSLRQNVSAQLSSLEVTGIEEVEAKLVSLQSRLDELRTGADAREAHHKEKSLRRDQALGAAKIKSDLQSCESRLEELNAKAAESDLWRRVIDAEKRARPVLIKDGRLGELDRELNELKAEMEKAGQDRLKAELELKELDPKLRELKAKEPEIKKLEAEQQSLRQLYANAKALLDDREKHTAAQKTLETAIEELKTAEAHKADLISQRATQETKSNGLVERCSRLDGLKAEKELLTRESLGLEKSVSRARELTVKNQVRAKAVADQSEARSLLETKETDLKRLQLDYHRSQAARLAYELKSGEPCPVCGSKEHPHPAELPPSAPTREAIDEAEAGLMKLRESASQRTLEVTRLTAEIEREESELTQSHPGEGDLLERIQLEWKIKCESVKAKESELRECQEAQKDLDLIRKSLAELTSQITAAELTLAKALQKRNEANVAAETCLARIQHLETLVPESQRKLETIKEHGVQLGEQISAFQTSLVEVNRLAESARHRISAADATHSTLDRQMGQKTAALKNATSERDDLLAKSGFGSIDECRSAGLDALSLEKLEKDLKEFDQNLSTAKNRVSELKTEAASVPEWAWDLETCLREFKEVDDERSKLKAEELSLESHIKQLSLVRDKASSTLNEIKVLEDRYRIAGRLSEVASGRPPNLSRVSFQRFVLASQLDEVLEQASRRLFEMSRGQFTLKRSRQLDDKRKSAGLDLEVEDAFTGTTRPTSTLSGGEGFQASLALALGLADVVQSHLGGVRLDAIFVDEGFGTLDSESLDGAIKILGELQAGGRLVGIISHVHELRDQIARRLSVRKGPDGSSIAWEEAASI